jgi:hypothetical protein
MEEDRKWNVLKSGKYGGRRWSQKNSRYSSKIKVSRAGHFCHI